MSRHVSTLRARTIGLALATGLIVVASGCGSSPDDDLARLRTLQEEGRFAESIEVAENVLKTQPEHPEANHRLGVALLQTGQPSQAVWPLRKAADTDEYAVESGLLLSTTLVQTRNSEQAIAAAEAVTERDPGNGEAWLALARARYSARTNEAALEAVERALAVSEGHRQALWIKGAILTEMKRFGEADETFGHLYELADEAGETNVAAQACVSRARVVGEKLEEKERADSLHEACLARFPTEPFVVNTAAQWWVSQEEPERAEKTLRSAIEQAPESLPFRLTLAQSLAATQQFDEAVQVLEEAGQDFQRPEPWTALADLYKARDDFEAAAETLGRARETLGDSEALRFKQADVLIDLERLDEADALAAGFEEPVYRHMIHGRVLLERGDPAGALESFEEGLLLWPNNPGVRFLTGQAYQQLGQPERALEEYRQAIRADAKATDAPLAAAYLAYELGLMRDAREYAVHQIRNRPYRDAQAHVIASRASQGFGNLQQAHQALDVLEAHPPARMTGIAERVRLLADTQGPAKAAEYFESRKVDLAAEGSEEPLRVYVDVLARMGRHGDGLAQVDRALAARPDVADLHDLRGRTLHAAGRDGDAKAAFERAVALDADNVRALSGLGALALDGGDPASARKYYERAVTADPEDPDPAYWIARIDLVQGRRAEAVAGYDAVLKMRPGHPATANDRAYLLAEEGEDLDRALQLARLAARAPGATANEADTLAFVRLARDEVDAAVELLRKSLETHPDSAALHYRLGQALARQGDAAAAVEQYRLALAAGPFPEAELARAEIAKLEAR